MHADRLVIGLGYAGLPVAREGPLAGLAVAGLGATTALVTVSERAAV
jgi:UDP-N-acetyl-D-mannosaminuronate dehydrogenase